MVIGYIKLYIIIIIIFKYEIDNGLIFAVNEIRTFYFCIVPPCTALNFLILSCPVFSL